MSVVLAVICCSVLHRQLFVVVTFRLFASLATVKAVLKRIRTTSIWHALVRELVREVYSSQYRYSEDAVDAFSGTRQLLLVSC